MCDLLAGLFAWPPVSAIVHILGGVERECFGVQRYDMAPIV